MPTVLTCPTYRTAMYGGGPHISHTAKATLVVSVTWCPITLQQREDDLDRISSSERLNWSEEFDRLLSHEADKTLAEVIEGASVPADAEQGFQKNVRAVKPWVWTKRIRSLVTQRNYLKSAIT